MDADLQHDPTLLPRFVTLANSAFDVVIGSRFAPGGSTPHFPWHRRWMSRLATCLVRAAAGLPALTDCTSGYRCIKAGALARCNLRELGTEGYAFQSALLRELIRSGARVTETPITFTTRGAGKSKLTFRDKVEFLGTVVRLAVTRRKV
jgi:dolichol-phosphate mannosyltransferase